MSRKTVRVFVYGTLKRGFGNNDLMNDSVFIKEAELEGFEMKNVNDAFPCITKQEGGIVKGELWEVPIDVLAYNIDMLEGYNPYSLHNMYNRIVVSVEDVSCFTYVWGNEEELPIFETIQGGKWIKERDLNR